MAPSKTGGISEDAHRVLVRLAPRLARALRDAGLFEALQATLSRLEQSIEERTAQLRKLHEPLEQEIALRRRAEDALKEAQDELEQKVQGRTAEIEKLKNVLREELHTEGDFVGESACIKNILKQIELVAPTDATVLILGESGTGKERIAREIHRRSLRADRPLIVVNCATIPRELYESEFFGHVKGAFTGAVRDRQGRFEAADGGTLFLDEVGEIPLELQSKLLRVLQEGHYERVGDTRTRKVNVRIIAATNRDLKQAVEEKAFREDLYYRLNVFPIEVAPLRSRKEDIPLLANHFLGLAAQRLKRPPPRLTEADIRDLQRYDWPGNIRELQNVIERAVILSRADVVQFDLPHEGMKPVERAPMAISGPLTPGNTVLTEKEMRELERENIRAALSRAGGKVYGPGGAAEMLGIKATTLIARMKKMGIPRHG